MPLFFASQGTRATASLTFLLDEVFKSDVDWLPSTSIDEELLTDMAAQKVAVMDEIVQAETKIKELKARVEDLWKNDRQTQYLLTSVFMHRGGSCCLSVSRNPGRATTDGFPSCFLQVTPASDTVRSDNFLKRAL